MANVHFRIGKGAANLLVTVAREHLQYNLNPEKALDAIMGSLVGIDRQTALDILSGHIVLEENIEEQTFDGHTYHPVGDKDYERFHPEFWAEQKLLKMKEETAGWRKAVKELRKTLASSYGRGFGEFPFSFTLSYKELCKYIYEGDAEIIFHQKMEDDPRIAHIMMSVNGIKNFIAEQLKVMQVIRWLISAYPEDVPHNFGRTPDELMRLYDDLFALMNGDSGIDEQIRRQHFNDNQLQAYLDGARRIDEFHKTELSPVNILDGYDAGWLAPNGDYYGLNGEIANMLHNQIADKLLDAGIIPHATHDDHRGNPDSWLEENGWVKIHGDHILFEGYNLHSRGICEERRGITPEQRKAIYEYGQLCCGGMLKFGITYKPISAARWNMTEDLMLHKLFDF